jgi:predicted PolB exonuclease-like 3'-5' exonuclease
VTQNDSQGSAQLPLANQDIKGISPMTFSQKLYQFHELEIAEEYEQAIDANSLERIKNLLDKLVELHD